MSNRFQPPLIPLLESSMISIFQCFALGWALRRNQEAWALAVANIQLASLQIKAPFFCWHQFHVRIYRVKSAEGSEFLSPIMDQCWDDWGLSGGLGECRDGCVGWGGLARSAGCPESGWSRSLLTTHFLFHSGDEPLLMAWTWPASRHQGCSLFRCHKPRTHPPPASLLKTHLSTRKANRVVTTNARARPLYA